MDSLYAFLPALVGLISAGLVYCQNKENNQNRLKEIEINAAADYQSQLRSASIVPLSELCYALNESHNEASKLVSYWGAVNGQERQDQLKKVFDTIESLENNMRKFFIYINPDIYLKILEISKEIKHHSIHFGVGVMADNIAIQNKKGFGWPEIIQAVENLLAKIIQLQKEIRNSIGFIDV